MTFSDHLQRAPGALIVVLCCVAMTGCGSSHRAPVEGTVTLDGQPVDGGTITFAPEDYREGGGERTAVSAEIKGGKYSLDAAHGPVVGKYRVDIHWKKKTGRLVPTDEPPGTKEEERDAVPPIYNSNSQTFAEIKAEGNKFDYTLTSRVNDENRPRGKPGSGNPNN